MQIFHQFLTDSINLLSNSKNICILRNPTERPKGASNPPVCDWRCRISLESAGHFNEKSGYKKFELLLNDIKRIITKDL